MRHECDIVRDLMPMCVDGTASDKTRAMVEEHVEECPPCDKVYAEMQREAKLELPVQSAAPEFVTTVKKMRSRRKRRTWLTLLLGVMIAAVVAVAGLAGYSWYFVKPHPIEDAQLTLVVSNDGIALIHAANVPKSTKLYIQYSAMEYPETAEGQYEGHVYLSATHHAARTQADDVYFIIGGVEADGSVVATDAWGGDVPVYRLLLGRNDGSGQVFYLASEEELQRVSIKGAHLKSPEYVSVVEGNQGYYEQHAFLTPTPRPVEIDEGIYTEHITATPISAANTPAADDAPTAVPVTTITPTPTVQ